MRNSISEYQLSDEADSSVGIKILDRLGFDPLGELVDGDVEVAVAPGHSRERSQDTHQMLGGKGSYNGQF